MSKISAIVLALALAACATPPPTATQAPASATPAAPAAPVITAPAQPVAATPAGAAAPAARVIASPAFVTLAEQDARIELKRGARIHVRLESERLMVTKRWWHITAVEGAALAPYGNPWFAANTAHAAYVAREHGNWIFDFDAVAPGESKVTFDYRRDDESVANAERHATFTFVVR